MPSLLGPAATRTATAVPKAPLREPGFAPQEKTPLCWGRNAYGGQEPRCSALPSRNPFTVSPLW